MIGLALGAAQIGAQGVGPPGFGILHLTGEFVIVKVSFVVLFRFAETALFPVRNSVSDSLFWSSVRVTVIASPSETPLAVSSTEPEAMRL